MSSLFFTFFLALFGTGFRDPFYRFSLIWQDFFLLFLPFLLRFCYAFVTLFYALFGRRYRGSVLSSPFGMARHFYKIFF